jgi:hypothetical protein
VLHIRPAPPFQRGIHEIEDAIGHQLAGCGVTLAAVRPAGTYEIRTWGTDGIQATTVRQIVARHGWEIVQEMTYSEWEARR